MTNDVANPMDDLVDMISVESYDELLDENYKLRQYIDILRTCDSLSKTSGEQHTIKIDCQKKEIDRLVKQVNALKNDKYVDKLTVAMHDLCISDHLYDLYPRHTNMIEKFCYRDPNPYRYISRRDGDIFVNYKKKILLDRLDELPDYIVKRFEEKNMTNIIGISKNHLRKTYSIDIDIPETDKSSARQWWHLTI